MASDTRVTAGQQIVTLRPERQYDELKDAIAKCQELQLRISRLLDYLRNLDLAESVDPRQQRPVTEDSELRKVRSRQALTKRETEVLKCIAEGHSTKQLAGILGITFKTAACHRYRVMQKLDIHSTAPLVRYAIRNGLV